MCGGQSPGSIYPTLQQLEDEGLVRSSERDGKRTFELTDEGRGECQTRLEEAGGPPWDDLEGADVPGSIRTFALAFKQVMVAGTPAQREQAVAILTDARKQLYRLLAEDLTAGSHIRSPGRLLACSIQDTSWSSSRSSSSWMSR